MSITVRGIREDLDIGKRKELETQMARFTWHVSLRMLPVLRRHFIMGWTIAKAARVQGLSPAGCQRTVRRLRAEGHIASIMEVLEVYEQPELEKEFWDGIKDGLVGRDWRAMELYARMTKKLPTPESQSAKVGIMINQENQERARQEREEREREMSYEKLRERYKI